MKTADFLRLESKIEDEAKINDKDTFLSEKEIKLVYQLTGLSAEDLFLAAIKMYLKSEEQKNRILMDLKQCSTIGHYELLKNKYSGDLDLLFECQEKSRLSKMDQRHQDMKAGKCVPALKKDVSTEKLWMLRESGLSYEKIAEEVGMSKSGVRSRLKQEEARRKDVEQIERTKRAMEETQRRINEESRRYVEEASLYYAEEESEESYRYNNSTDRLKL